MILRWIFTYVFSLTFFKASDCETIFVTQETVSGSMQPSLLGSMSDLSMLYTQMSLINQMSSSLPQSAVSGSVTSLGTPVSMSLQTVTPQSMVGNTPSSTFISTPPQTVSGGMSPLGQPGSALPSSMSTPESGSVLPSPMLGSMSLSLQSDSTSLLISGSMSPPVMSGSMSPSLWGSIPSPSMVSSMPQSSLWTSMPPLSMSGYVPPPMSGSIPPSMPGSLPPLSMFGSMSLPNSPGSTLPLPSGSISPPSLLHSMSSLLMSERYGSKLPYESMSWSVPPSPSGNIPPSTIPGNTQPLPMSGSLSHPTPLGSTAPPPSGSMPPPPPSISGSMPPPPSISGSMPPPPPSISGSMPPPPPPSISGSMPPPPPPSISGSMPPPPPPSISGSMPPPPPPSISGSMPPPPSPSMSGSMPPPPPPSISGSMPPPPPPSISGSMPPPPPPSISGSMPPSPPPSISGSMPPPPPPSISGSMPPPPPPSLSGSMPPPPPQSMSGSISPPPPPSISGSMPPPPPSISGSMPAPPPPSISGSMPPPPPPSISGSMPPPPPPSISGSMPPPPPSISGSMPPPPPSISGSMPPPPPPSISGSMPQPPPQSMSGSMPPPPPPSISGSMPPPPPASISGSMPPPPPASISGSMPPPPPSISGSMPPTPPSITGSMPPPPTSISGSMPPPPPSISGSMPPPPPPSMSGSMPPPPPSISGSMPPPPPPSISGSMPPPPPSISGSMPPPPPPSMSGSMPPPPPPSISGSMPPLPPSISGSMPPPPPPSMAGSMPSPPPSISGSMPPPPPPSMSGSMPPLSPPSMSGSLPPPPPPSVSGSMPPPPPPSMSGSMPPPPPPYISGSMPPPSPPSISGSMPPPPPPSMSGSISPPPPPSISGSMPTPPPPSMSGSMPPPPPSISGSMPPPPPPSISGSMPPPPPSISGSMPPPPPTSMSGSMPPPQPTSISGSMPPPPPPSISGSMPPPPPPSMSGSMPPPSISGSMPPPPPPSMSGSMPPLSPPSISGSMPPPPPPSISGSTPPPSSEYIHPSSTVMIASSSAVFCLGEIDSCNGMCTSDPSYKNTTDCSGTCNGTAYIDSACSGFCVGGTTGVLTNVSRDCNGICNGTNVLDSCDVCGPPYNETSGSLYRGCDGICYSPANLNEKAVTNKCGQCTGGATGRNATFGIDVCGECGGNASSCADCEGVPNGGKIFDACGVCGGTGTTCLAVAAVMPDYIPDFSQFSINVYGAGFNLTNLECFLVNSNTTTETPLTISDTIGTQNITAIVPATLVVDEYTVYCRIRGSSTPKSNVNITVYDASSVTVTSITPTAFIKGQPTDTQQLTITGTEFVTNHTYCMITGPSLSIIVDAVVSSATAATCNINHPATSMAMEVSVSLNKVTKIGTPTTVKAQAAAPTAVAKFTDIGDAIVVKFDVPVDISNFRSCDDFFMNLTGAVCQASSPRLIFISIAGSALAIGDTIIPKLDAIKKANELEAIPFNDSLTIQTADNPAKPVVNIIGPSEVGGCVSDIVLDAGSSTGIGLNYTWTVSPTSVLTGSNTSSVAIVNATANNYTFTLIVTNNLNQLVITNHMVEKKSVTAPELFVISTGGKTVKVSDSFDLVAKAKLIDGCVDVQLLYTWSFSGGIIADANRKNLARYIVDANTLPANQQITATVDIALSSDPQTIVISALVTFNTVYPPLSAYIKGSTERRVGVDSGTFELDASISVDPSNVGNMQYEWNCVQPSTTSPCVFNGVNGITSRTAVFSMPANKLVAGNSYNFYVTVTSDTRTDRADVVVVAISGVPPQVDFRLLPNGGFTSVDKVVSLIAEIETNGNSFIRDTNWESVQLDGYGYIDLSLAENRNYEPRYFSLGGNKHLVAFSIKKYVLMKGQKYRVKVTVTDNSNNQVPSIVDFQTYQGVSSCSFAPLSTYMIFSEITFTATGCVTDSEGGALSYKLLVDTDENGNEQRLSPDSVSNSITLPFAPKANLGSKNKFTIEVCAQRGGCMRVRAEDVTVTANTATAAQVESNVLNEVSKLSKTSNPLDGTVVLSVYLKSKGTSSRRKRDVTTNSVYTLMLNLVESVLNTTKTETSLRTLLDTMSAVQYMEVSDADLNKLVGFYNEILTFLKTNNIRVQKDAVKSMTEFALNIKSRSILVSFEEDIRKTLSHAFEYGDEETYVIGTSHTIKMSEDFLGSSYETGASTNPIAVDFGSTLLDQYKSWTCGSGKCAGVFITSKHYETGEDPYSITSSDQTKRVSDVLDVTIEDPSTGTSLSSVSNLASPISFIFPITQAQPGKTYVCKYWDPSTSEWLTSGMTTTSQNSTSAKCTSNHLTSFAVFYVNVEDTDDSPDMTWALVGGILAAFTVILIAAVLFMSLVVMKQKKNKVLSIVVHPLENGQKVSA